MNQQNEKILTNLNNNSSKVKLDETSMRANAAFNSKKLQESIDNELKILERFNEFFSFK